MDQVKKFYKQQPVRHSLQEINDLVEIFEESFDMAPNKIEDIYRQIALVHLFVGYPNQDHRFTESNVRINDWIIKLKPLVDEFREKYHG